jgi:hypothetical protein
VRRAAGETLKPTSEKAPFWLHAIVLSVYAALVTGALLLIEHWFGSKGLICIAALSLGGHGGMIWQDYWRGRQYQLFLREINKRYANTSDPN